MAQFLPFHVPDIGREDIDAVVEALESGWLTTGPKAKEFENRFKAAVNAPYAVALNSGTAALHLALHALGLQPGDEVILPALTFAATAEAVCYFGARPVLVDSNPHDGNLNPAAVERAITPRTRVLLPVHYAGQPCDMDAILHLARAHSLAAVEDAAHAFPAAHRGCPVGSLGDVTCFSFYATKTITTG